jgi:hypothetical protein
MQLEPRVWVEVGACAKDGQVTFSSSRATLGHPDLDANFQLTMSSTLTAHSPVPHPSVCHSGTSSYPSACPSDTSTALSACPS